MFPRPEDPTPDPLWPLLVYLCDACALLQLGRGAPPEEEEAGLAGLARLSHDISEHSASLAAEIAGIAGGGRVLELASHGNYLAPDLAEHGIRPLIVEASEALAAALEADGHQVLRATLDPAVARELVGADGPFDVVVDSFLLPHLLDPDAFVAALDVLLAPGGTIVLEINHLLPIVEERQFDAFRHGHFAYLSLTALQPLLARHALVAVGAAQFEAYGGTLRVFVRHDSDRRPVDESVGHILELEHAAGLADRERYLRLGADVDELRRLIHAYLVDAAAEGRTIAGYGAPSRATALVNACGITPDLLRFTVDRSAYKQGRTLGGTRIPIRAPEALVADRPAVVLVLLWNLADEVARQLRPLTDDGTTLVVPIPGLRTLDGGAGG